jgi:hypothetical protein
MGILKKMMNKKMMKPKGMKAGGLTLDPMSRKQSFVSSKDSGLRNVGTQAERDLGLRIHRGPGMKNGGMVKSKGMRKGGSVMKYKDGGCVAGAANRRRMMQEMVN